MAWEGLNRRKFPRANFPCLIKILREGHPEEIILTHTENISVGGACVIIKRSLDLFTPVGIEIDLMDSADLIVCRGRIVWSVRRKAIEEFKPSFYDLGLEFLDLTQGQRDSIEHAVAHLVKSGHETPLR